MAVKQVEYFKVSDWYFAATPSDVADKWLVWCAKVPLVSPNPLREPPNVEVWFEYAETIENGCDKLKAELNIVGH